MKIFVDEQITKFKKASELFVEVVEDLSKDRQMYKEALERFEKVEKEKVAALEELENLRKENARLKKTQKEFMEFVHAMNLKIEWMMF